jgi:ankyrin repeat protein
MLINHGADINQNLLYAARRGYKNMVVFLLEESAEIDYLSPHNETPLNLASQGKHWETAKILLEKGANSALQNAQGQTSLMSAVLTGEAKMVNLLINSTKTGSLNSELENADFLVNTPLMTAAVHGYLDIVKILLDNGAKVESRNRWKESALILAASKGFREIVRLLIQYGADLHSEDITEKTALLRAAQTGHLLVVEMLLAQGANLHINAIDLGGEGGTALIQAARNGHNDVLQTLLKAGAIVDEKELIFHHSALMVAALNGHKETVDLLLTAGANPALTDTSQRSALLLAATNNHLSVVIQLLDSGQSGIQTDSNGNGIWHLLAMSDVENRNIPTSSNLKLNEEGVPTEMQVLFSRKILLDSINNNGETALMIAAKHGKMKLVKNLLELGASHKILTPEGKSAFTFATASGNNELAKLLR